MRKKLILTDKAMKITALRSILRFISGRLDQSVKLKETTIGKVFLRHGIRPWKYCDLTYTGDSVRSKF